MMKVKFKPAIGLLLQGIVVSFLCLAAGCKGQGSSVAKAHGQVFFKGTPLAGGTLVFIPDASRGSTGPLVRAVTEPDGSFLLRTEQEPGVLPGWYRVTVMALEQAPPAGDGQHFTIPRSLVPDKYRDPELSGLSCEVKAGVDNGITLNLD